MAMGRGQQVIAAGSHQDAPGHADEGTKRSSVGEHVRSFQPWGEVWARVEPLSGKVRIETELLDEREAFEQVPDMGPDLPA